MREFINDVTLLFGVGNLSSGRVGIVTMANANLHSAVVIGIRYSAARRQFGPDEGGNGQVSISPITFMTTVSKS